MKKEFLSSLDQGLHYFNLPTTSSHSKLLFVSETKTFFSLVVLLLVFTPRMQLAFRSSDTFLSLSDPKSPGTQGKFVIEVWEIPIPTILAHARR